MPKFNPGDRVRCINVDGDTNALGVGSINVITNYLRGQPWPYNATEEESGLALAYSESELELVTDE
jgi:hypothetical protein